MARGLPAARLSLCVRTASRVHPDVAGTRPFNFPTLVQPVLDKHCVTCHGEKGKRADLRGLPPGARTRSYAALKPYAFYYDCGNDWNRYVAGDTMPGHLGARAPPLFKTLGKGHEKVRLTQEERYRLSLWLDCNGVYFGAHEDTGAQARGEAVLPRLE